MTPCSFFFFDFHTFEAGPRGVRTHMVEEEGTAGVVVLCGLALAGLVVNAISRRDVNSQAQINSQYVTLRLFTVAQQQESWLGAFHLNQE